MKQLLYGQLAYTFLFIFQKGSAILCLPTNLLTYLRTYLPTELDTNQLKLVRYFSHFPIFTIFSISNFPLVLLCLDQLDFKCKLYSSNLFGSTNQSSFHEMLNKFRWGNYLGQVIVFSYGSNSVDLTFVGIR